MSRIVLLMGLLLTVSLSAHAEQRLYAGIGIGSSRVKLRPFDSTDTGLQLFAGYRFGEGGLPWNGTWGIEGGYVDFGSPRDGVLGQALKLSLDGVKVYAVANKALGERWSLYGKLGVIAWNEDASVNGSRGSTHGSDAAAGIGFEVQTGKRPLRVRAEIEGFDFHDGVWLVSVSVVYRIGRER
jgi:OOP family OmpA-OmpF porin